MRTITVPTDEQVSPTNQAIFDQLKKGLGFAPKLYASFAHSDTTPGKRVDLTPEQILEIRRGGAGSMRTWTRWPSSFPTSRRRRLLDACSPIANGAELRIRAPSSRPGLHTCALISP